MRPTALALLLALASFGCGDDPAPTPETPAAPAPPAATARQSVADVLSANPRLTTTARLVEAAGLGETLRDTATAYTLFAPSDDAWAALGADALADLEADGDVLRAALLNHVLETRMLSFDVFPDLSIDAAGGGAVAFEEVGEGLAVVGPAGRARITDADLDADNGVVHVVDAVIAVE